MKFAILASAMLFGATAASAVTYTSQPLDTGPAANQTIVVDFETGMTPPAGVTYGGSYTIDNLTTNGFRAAPAGDTTNYFATPGSNDQLPGTATIDFSGYVANTRAIRSLSFYWGSIDSYNTLEVLSRTGSVLATITGDNINNPANGDQSSPATNRRVFLQFSPTEDFGSLRLTSTQRAFEIDNIATAAVPEPTTWAMLIVGMGFVGFASRRRTQTRQVSY